MTVIHFTCRFPHLLSCSLYRENFVCRAHPFVSFPRWLLLLLSHFKLSSIFSHSLLPPQHRNPYDCSLFYSRRTLSFLPSRQLRGQMAQEQARNGGAEASGAEQQQDNDEHVPTPISYAQAVVAPVHKD